MSTDPLSQAAYDTIHSAPMGTKEIARRMGVGHQILINKCNPGCETNKLTLHEALAIQMITNDTRILEAMAEELGVKVLGQIGQTKQLMQGILDMTRETGEVAGVVQQALSDDVITVREQEQCAREINEAIDALVSLRAAISRKAKEDAK